METQAVKRAEVRYVFRVVLMEDTERIPCRDDLPTAAFNILVLEAICSLWQGLDVFLRIWHCRISIPSGNPEL
jgi:hypothetical protein